MRTRWISPQLIATNRLDDVAAYDELKRMGQKVVELLGIETSATHMEWFSGKKGLKFSEIGCRPPGVRTWDLYNVANDMDLYREWAMAVCAGRPSQRASRRLAAGLIALRPECDGTITGYDGLDDVGRAFGPYIIDAHLPPAGHPTQPVAAGYMANAWVRLKHYDYDELRRMLDVVGADGQGAGALSTITSPTITLIGPQRPVPTLAGVLRALDVKSIALVTAGWQEREGEDGIAQPGVPAVELRLHARTEALLVADPELGAAYKARQVRLRLMQDIYRARLGFAEAGTRAIAIRSAPADLLAEEFTSSVEQIRHIDRDHMARCRVVHTAFEAALRPLERPLVAQQRADIAEALDHADALVIAGGHVAVLLNRLRLFDVLSLAAKKPIVAWSAGAMVLTERVVLYHDDPPTGDAISEILDGGLGLVPGVVALPEARTRLHLTKVNRVSELARRYAPSVCTTLDYGAELVFDGTGGTIVRASGVQRLDPAGTVHGVQAVPA